MISNLSDILSSFYSDSQKENSSAFWEKLDFSAISFHQANRFTKSDGHGLFVAPSREVAAYFYNDLQTILGKDKVLFYPSSKKQPYQIEETDNANILNRTEVLQKVTLTKEPLLIVSYGNALSEKVYNEKALEENTFKIQVGNSLDTDFLNETLFSFGFTPTDFVTEPGEYVIRGGIVDVFSFGNNEPYRIELFSDEVESIRTFDIETQLSIKSLESLLLVPNLEEKKSTTKVTLLEFLGKNTQLWLHDYDVSIRKLNDFYEKAEEVKAEDNALIKKQPPSELFISGDDFLKEIETYTTQFTGLVQPSGIEVEKKTYPIRNQSVFNKKFELFFDHFENLSQEGFTLFLLCNSEKQILRFKEMMEDLEREIPIQYLKTSLFAGFEDHRKKIAVYTDHQLFERYYKYNLKDNQDKKNALTLKELTDLSIGDFVTHIDHGIGKFGGLQKIDVNGKTQEAIKLVYENNDILYVSIHSLYKITRYSGGDGLVTVSKLGSPQWSKFKKKTKAKVKEIAFDLIQLYAKRRLKKGFAYQPDTYLQLELESSFMYEDTPDQAKATEEVKRDMESSVPMDRLICGDVGFGKTEVAIRAAFKAATDGKQVAVLVPTTVLAFQHYKTFSKRLEEFPVKVEYLNRFRTAKQKKEVLEGLKNGSVDIVIGTHQLVGKGIEFADLGLLVIDEEQKFGVSVKDKLKTLKENVDTLTLTATPIPRTLQFSLMAARDMSIIRTPPPNRQPIDTQICGFNEAVIRDAIRYELQRDGQVFVINNRVENIKEVAGMISRLVPDARVNIAHGQMEGKKLEKNMLDFMSEKFDVLVATSIVESGLDVPNANTMLIINAHYFGLADLHQMRGRVGRSNKKAFCYLVTPPLDGLTEIARKRLKAIAQFSDLGGGFHIAMKDLEVRGSGNLLGGEQSGFISEMGFDTYQKILAEAIEELKEKEFKELYPKDATQKEEYVKELNLDTDIEILFPDTYINSVNERFALYSKLADVKNEEELQRFIKNLVDRFGDLPQPTVELMNSVRLKWKGKEIGFEKIILKNGSFIGYFVSNPNSSFYQSEKFASLLQRITQNPQLGTFKEKVNPKTPAKKSLLFRMDNISGVNHALERLAQL